MARFEREAQMLAALNHPNIATVYGIEQGALVMELVEGADLKGPLPLDEALAIARPLDGVFIGRVGPVPSLRAADSA